jgi:hypothetical protein
VTDYVTGPAGSYDIKMLFVSRYKHGDDAKLYVETIYDNFKAC